MKTKILLLTILPLLSATWAAAEDPDYIAGKNNWLSGNYYEAYEKLLTFRNKPYGRRPEVDYMLATSACRLPDLTQWGLAVLEWMPQGYPLSADALRIIDEERNLWQRGTTNSAPLPSADSFTAMVSAGVQAVGKTFYWADRDIPINSYPAKRIRQIGLDAIEKRLQLTAVQEPEGLVRENLRSLGYEAVNMRHTNHFVIASLAGQASQQLDRMDGHLESYLSFLVRQYEMPIPDHYITIYLVHDTDDLRRLADRLHGLDVSPATIGYTFVEDRSAVGVIPGDRFGTLRHELFHLLVRSDFGDIPQWLDEGMASLYEEAEEHDGKFIGTPGWRGRVLRELWPFHPKSLQELITSEWFASDLPDSYEDATGDHDSIKRQAAYLATARYFMIYLQEQGKLADMLKAFRNRSRFWPNSNESSLELARSVLNQKPSVSEADFWRWLEICIH